MRIINRDDKPPTLHGSRAGRRLAVSSGNLSRISAGRHALRSRTGRNGYDSRPGANSPFGRNRP
jgi:hypothetical protein